MYVLTGGGLLVVRQRSTGLNRSVRHAPDKLTLNPENP